MSGHSKWSTIKRKKGEKDQDRAKVFTKVSREILVCIKETGNIDPEKNGRLAGLISKAKRGGVPSDNINRLLKKAAGGGEKADFENCRYEGYGIGGVAVIVDCLTDNRNRTAGEIRHYFDKYGGNMGGSVAHLFTPKGLITLDGYKTVGKEQVERDYDEALNDVIEADGGDMDFETVIDDNGDDILEIKVESEPFKHQAVADKLEKMGYVVKSSETVQVPSMTAAIDDGEQLAKFNTMLDIMLENDDVQDVWHNLENE